MRMFLFIALLCAASFSPPAAQAQENWAEIYARQTTSAPTQAPIPTARPHVQEMIAASARRHGVPVAMGLAVARIESGFNCQARGRAGELGPLQIKPATARGLGYAGPIAALRSCGAGLDMGMRHLAAAFRRCGTISGAARLHNGGLGSSCTGRSAYSGRVARLTREARA